MPSLVKDLVPFERSWLVDEVVGWCRAFNKPEGVVVERRAAIFTSVRGVVESTVMGWRYVDIDVALWLVPHLITGMESSPRRSPVGVREGRLCHNEISQIPKLVPKSKNNTNA